MNGAGRKISRLSMYLLVLTMINKREAEHLSLGPEQGVKMFKLHLGRKICHVKCTIDLH